jgi:hypothetical protein
LNEVAKSDRSSRPAAMDAPVPLREAVAKFRIGDTMRQWCVQCIGPRLNAVILTGSLARSEATWRQTEKGVEFFSDAEFIVIAKSRHEVPSAELVTLICSGAEEELRNRGVWCKLSIGAVPESFLRNLGDTIFGHELLTCGEVLYGDPDILLSKTRETSLRVSEEDAWRLLANRMIELLELAPELADGRALLSEAAQYRLTKLYCDMATSILVFKQQFVAGYQARNEALTQLHERGLLLDLPFDVDWFVAMVQRCTKYKIEHSWNGSSPFATAEAAPEAVAALRSLWSWELARMDEVAVSEPRAMLRLHMQKQKMTDRLRGWAFVARRRGVLDSLRHGRRWLRLLQSASPRYCVYAAGIELLSSLELPPSDEGQLEIPKARLETTLAWLPLGDPFARPAVDVNDAAKAVLWDYQEFLVETRA